MGGKNSKTELSRSKSISTFGRSSQRSLFQKSKLALIQINKKLLKTDSVNQEEIQIHLEKIEADLNGISPTIKEKNKQKYEDILKQLQETKDKFREKIQPTQQVQQIEQTPNQEGGPQTVELKLVKVANSQETVETQDEGNIENEENVEMRKPLQIENQNQEIQEVPTSPKVKFGVQVMPLDPRVSQELLKRNTLPTNELPKQEFKKIRNISDSGVSLLEKMEKFEASISSPNGSKKVELETLVKREVDGTALETIELITQDVDVLENKLKYFKGKKWDTNYMELHKLFINNLIKLDNVQVQGDPVVKQERKIVVKRIQELIKILECLGEQEETESDESEKSESNASSNQKGDQVIKKKEEIINSEGKPVTATAL